MRGKSNLTYAILSSFLLTQSRWLKYRVRSDHLHNGCTAKWTLVTASSELVSTFVAGAHVPTPIKQQTKKKQANEYSNKFLPRS
jgi:hypothetical protein